MSKQLDVAIVYWDDSTCKSHWHHMEDTPTELDHCVTVGFVVARTKTHITLTQSLAGKNMQDNSWLIPRSTIKSIEVLMKAERPK